MSDLVEQIDALLALNAKGAVSHPVPGLAVELLERAKAELAARRAANTPVDGWVMVPRKATDQMYVAFRDQLNEGGHIYRFVEAYEAMLAAAPTSPALPSQVVGVSIEQLQAAHVERQEEWCPDQKPDLSFRGNEMAGEVGEACNVIKKLERERHGWRGSRDTLEHLGEELADVVHTAILCAITAGIDLGPYVVKKFNDTSEKNGLKSRIQACLTSPAAEPVGIVVAEDDDLSVYWYEGFAVSEGDELYTHPAPSASREVTVTDEMVERACRAAHPAWDEAVTDSDKEWRRKQMRAALLAALPEREGKNGW